MDAERPPMDVVARVDAKRRQAVAVRAEAIRREHERERLHQARRGGGVHVVRLGVERFDVCGLGRDGRLMPDAVVRVAAERRRRERDHEHDPGHRPRRPRHGTPTRRGRYHSAGRHPGRSAAAGGARTCPGGTASESPWRGRASAQGGPSRSAAHLTTRRGRPHERGVRASAHPDPAPSSFRSETPPRGRPSALRRARAAPARIPPRRASRPCRRACTSRPLQCPGAC